MGELTTRTAGAVAIGPRRHRGLTGTAGILLFACMFLPALKGCSSTPVLPLDVPPFLPPYLYGLAFAFVALARTRHGLVAGVLALRALALVVAFAGFVVFLVAPAVGIVELTIGLTLLSAIGLQGTSEGRVALTAVVIGAVCTLWFGLWSTAEDALLGVHLSLASSIGMLAGGALWMWEVARERPVIVPVAVLRRR